MYDDDDLLVQQETATDAETAAETAAVKSTSTTAAATSPEFSAVSPVKIVARGDVKIGYFDVSQFIKSVGAFAKVG